VDATIKRCDGPTRRKEARNEGVTVRPTVGYERTQNPKKKSARKKVPLRRTFLVPL
jgi:hypothetical protein